MHPLLEDDLGPVHELIRRIVTAERKVPAPALDFREPLRARTGRPLTGSMLLVPANLDDVLDGWLVDAPVFILVVDSDDKPAHERMKVLTDALARNSVSGAAAVAIKEFESWLIADQAALDTILRPGHPSPAAPEDLGLRVAKQQVNSWCQAVANDRRPLLAVRRELAAALDLETVRKKCPSFDAFCKELAALAI